MLDKLIRYDQEVFLYLNALGSPAFDGFWMFVTNKYSSIPLYLGLLWLSFRTFGKRRILVLFVCVALMVLCTDQFTNFFKHGVARLRPCYDLHVIPLMRLVKETCGGNYGYFSGHASNSFALATFFTALLHKRYPVLLPVLFLWAALVGYSRIYIGVHYPLDVVSGALVGTFMGWMFSKLYILILPKVAP